MAGPLLPDEIWELIRPILPPRPPRLRGGRPPVKDRDALTGILFVLKTGLQWQDLPGEMGCGSGMTCLRRLREWQENGIWRQVENLLLSHLREADRFDWPRAWVRIESEGGRFGSAVRAMPRPRDSQKVCRCADDRSVRAFED